MTPECMQPMGVGRGDHWFPEFGADCRRDPVRIHQSFVKMTYLDRIETIDLSHQSPPNRAADDVEWMRRNREKRIAPALPELSQVGEVPKFPDFLGAHVKQNNVRAPEANFRSRNKQDPHLRGMRKNLFMIKNRVMQGDCQNTKAQRPRALQKLVRRIVDDVLRIIVGVNVEINFDPLALVSVLGHLLKK